MESAVGGSGSAGLTRPEWIAFTVLLLLAAAFRWIEWSRSVAIFNDGPEYLALARAAAAGHWTAVLAHPFHPLYPAVVAGVHTLGAGGPGDRGWETAAVLVGVAGGTAAVGCLFGFVRDAFGTGPAWIAAALLSVQARAVEYSSDVQSDGLYLALFLAATWLLWRAWTRRRAPVAAAAGLCAGLAYLTRPEGIGLAIVGVGLAGLAWLRGQWRLRAAAGWSAALVVGTGLCVAPYVLALHAQSGEWTLTHKKSILALSGLAAAPAPAPAPPASPAGRSPAEGSGPAPAGPPAAASPADALVAPLPPAAAAWIGPRNDTGADGLAVERAHSRGARALAAAHMLDRTSRSAFRYGMLVLLVAGLVDVRGRPGRRGVFLALIVALYAVALYALTYHMGYVSHRHALPPLVPLFGYAGLGAIAIGRWLHRLGAQRGLRLARVSPAVAAAAVAALVGLGEVATQLAPRRAADRAAREAAEWRRTHAEPGPLATTRLRLGYYAGMPYVPFVRADDASLAAYLRVVGARYVLLDDPEDVEAVRRAGGRTLRTLYRVREGEREAWVFERVGQSASKDTH